MLVKNSGIKILSDDQDGKGSREGGLASMQGYITRFSDIAGVFTINDPQAIGSDLAAKQLGCNNLVITSVDGAPDIENALEANTQIVASAGQNPYAIAAKAVELGIDITNGKPPEKSVVLIPSKLVTRDNVKDYKGWSAPR